MSDKIHPPRPPAGEQPGKTQGDAAKLREDALSPEAPGQAPRSGPETPADPPPPPSPMPPGTPHDQNPQPHPVPPAAQKQFPEGKYGEAGSVEPPPETRK